MKKTKKKKSPTKRAKRVVKKKKVVSKKRTSKKKDLKPKRAKAVKKTPPLPEPIGHVTHYFAKAQATCVTIEREGIRVGDLLYYKGHTTNFKDTVRSLQIDRKPVSEAGVGDEVGIQTKSRTREHDLVYKL